MGEWISKISYIHATEYYAALKSKGIPTCGTPWMNLGGHDGK
jgi:hypothetical protein